MSLSLDELKNKLNQSESVDDINSEDLRKVMLKQQKLNLLVSELSNETNILMHEYKQELNKNPSSNKNNIYILNQKLEHIGNNPRTSKINSLNSNISQLTEEIYKDIINIRKLEHKYETLNSKEKLHLEKMIYEYSKKYKEIMELENQYTNRKNDKHLEDIHIKYRNNKFLYVSGTLFASVFIAVSIYLFRKK
jgi:uncharacterized lipoprotein YehR (DUF1307 family)